MSEWQEIIMLKKIFSHFYKNNIYDLEILNLMGLNVKLVRKKKNNFIGLINNKKFSSKKIFLNLINKW